MEEVGGGLGGHAVPEGRGLVGGGLIRKLVLTGFNILNFFIVALPGQLVIEFPELLPLVTEARLLEVRAAHREAEGVLSGGCTLSSEGRDLVHIVVGVVEINGHNLRVNGLDARLVGASLELGVALVGVVFVLVVVGLLVGVGGGHEMGMLLLLFFGWGVRLQPQRENSWRMNLHN